MTIDFKDFKVGDSVKFKYPHWAVDTILIGRIIRINKKTISVILPNTRRNVKFRLHPSELSHVEKTNGI